MDKILDKIKELYSGNLAMHGTQSKSVGWKTQESQNLRFEKLGGVIEDVSRTVVVNDYGCGYGAHLEYLAKAGVQVTEYNGYDISSEMLEKAKEKLVWFPGRLNLHKTANIQTEADYTFVSGTFNVRFDCSEQEWVKYIESKLDEINSFSRRGFAFNLLSTYVDWKEDHLYYGCPGYWFDYCKKNLSRYVNLIHDYALFEWTIIVKK